MSTWQAAHWRLYLHKHHHKPSDTHHHPCKNNKRNQKRQGPPLSVNMLKAGCHLIGLHAHVIGRRGTQINKSIVLAVQIYLYIMAKFLVCSTYVLLLVFFLHDLQPLQYFQWEKNRIVLFCKAVTEDINYSPNYLKLIVAFNGQLIN